MINLMDGGGKDGEMGMFLKGDLKMDYLMEKEYF